jgi:alpha-L-rhamnosidase
MRVTLRNVTPGAEVVMRHAELLGPDGRLFTEPLRTAKATDTYVARGDSDEIYEPLFTFHGFRFAEITGLPPDDVNAEAVVIHSDLERTGAFVSSDPLIEKLHANVVWGQRGNFVSVPTDCPQRDERLGWTGDAQVFSPTASYLYDCETFWENWLGDLACDQGDDGIVPPVVPDIGLGIGNGAAGWGDAAVVVPWTTYEIYGDDSVLRESMPSMKAWADWVQSRLDDDLKWRRDFQFGDWLDPDAPAAEPWKAKARFDLVATAYAVRINDLVARSATVIGEKDIATQSLERAAQLREAWWRNFGTDALTTQTGCALAICFDLAPSRNQEQDLGDALANLIHEAGDHLATGFLGTPVLLPALTKTNHLDVAYAVLQQETSPSWLYQVIAGATTIWERWDALRPDGSVPMDALGGGSGSGMVSFNHYAYGAVADWLHRTVAGLAPDPAEPGYRHVLVEPRPGGRLTSASAELASRYGRTSVGWRIDGGRFVLDVTIPPNASATVTLPNGSVTRMGSGSRTFGCPWPAAGFR